MNALLIAAAVVCQWDMTPQPRISPAKWDMSPAVAVRSEIKWPTPKQEKLLEKLLPKEDEEPTPLVPVPGKQPTPQKTVIVNRGYPLRNGSRYWVYYNGNYNQPYSASVQHLETGEHAGQFDPDWLRTLSQEDRDWLHSHHHAGIVDWNYAKRPGQFVKPAEVATAPKPAKKMKLVQMRYCNGRGGCYYQNVWVEDKS